MMPPILALLSPTTIRIAFVAILIMIAIGIVWTLATDQARDRQLRAQLNDIRTSQDARKSVDDLPDAAVTGRLRTFQR